MGAIETMMIDSAYSQVGKLLGLPTHAYIGLSDSKCVDVQAGLETGMGAILGALSGINMMSGGGMMDYESAQSFEKLVIDNDICGMAYRLVQGIEQRDEPLALELFSEPGAESDFLTHPHTLAWHALEQKYPQVINRDGYEQWVHTGKPSLAEVASRQVTKLLSEESHPCLSEDLVSHLHEVMVSHGKKFGMDRLPIPG
jgi:trimethylamine--corrinoid protein Co-methyltransferase